MGNQSTKDKIKFILDQYVADIDASCIDELTDLFAESDNINNKTREFIKLIRSLESQSTPMHEIFDMEFGDGEFVRIFGEDKADEQ
jgi:hypothetical protein